MADEARLAQLRHEWEKIQWALDQDAYATETERKRAAARQLAIERELDGAPPSTTGNAK